MITAKEALIKSLQKPDTQEFYDLKFIEKRIDSACQDNLQEIIIPMNDKYCGLSPSVLNELLELGFDIDYITDIYAYRISW